MNIKGVIKEKGETINSVAEKLGINRISLTRSISNNPTYERLKDIANVLDCDVADFFKDEATHVTQEKKTDHFFCPHCGAPLDIIIKEKAKD